MSRPLSTAIIIGAFCLSFMVTAPVSADNNVGSHESFGKLAAFEGRRVWQPQYGCQGKLNEVLLRSPMWCREQGNMRFYDRAAFTGAMGESW